jgi:hypothetical protein
MTFDALQNLISNKYFNLILVNEFIFVCIKYSTKNLGMTQLCKYHHFRLQYRRLNILEKETNLD